MINISIITIFKGDNSNELLPTLKSALRVKFRSKSLFNIRNILILNTNLKLKKKHRKFLKVYINEDNGLYNAMNIGLDKIFKNEYVIFLNAGDKFHHKFNIINFYAEFKKNKCISFKADILYFDKYLLTNNKDKKFLCHNSLFVPYTNIKFNENIEISADSVWMEENIKFFGIIYMSECSTIYKGMGISDKPTFKTNIIYYKNYNLKKFILRSIYQIIFKLLSKKTLVKILAFKRGYVVKKI